MAARIEIRGSILRRWPLGKKDDGPGNEDGRPDRKMGAREAKKTAGKRKIRPGAESGRREASEREILALE